MKNLICMMLVLAFTTPAWAAPQTARAPTAEEYVNQVNDDDLAPVVGAKSAGPSVLRAQILLDRAFFSPGEFDARYGANMRAAVAGFQGRNKLRVTGIIDKKTWAALNRDSEPALVSYTITEEDLAGPFQAIPQDMMEKSKLTQLGYASVDEALGERFHTKPALLAQLNPGKNLSEKGEKISVPSVNNSAPQGAEKVVVDKSQSTVALVDAKGMVIAQYPATIGSKHDPLPLGTWKINGVGRNPTFKYNPDLFWDADNNDSKALIPAGPNNPVGVVWIDLSRPHYGIHGTPEPSTIRRTESHGCIRLSNWNALALAEAVSPGMPAILQK
jgi:lipoprotein-anchoring transpeptidase ErfK/SrfK